MKQETVAATVPASGDKPEMTASITVNYVDTAGGEAALKEAVSMFGPEALLTNALSNWKITLQSNIRNGLRRGETAEQLQARLGSAKMGVSAQGVKVDPVQAYLAQFAAATPDKQKQMLAELQARAAKK